MSNQYDIVSSRLKNSKWTYCFYRICQFGNKTLLDAIISQGKDLIDYDCGFLGACRGGHVEVVEQMIQKGVKYWNWGFSEAQFFGNTDVVNYLQKLMEQKINT